MDVKGGAQGGEHKRVCKVWPGAQMFPLPSQPARAAILGIHTRRWHQPPRPDLLAELAQRCVGFCGADLKAPPKPNNQCMAVKDSKEAAHEAMHFSRERSV